MSAVASADAERREPRPKARARPGGARPAAPPAVVRRGARHRLVRVRGGRRRGIGPRGGEEGGREPPELEAHGVAVQGDARWNRELAKRLETARKL